MHKPFHNTRALLEFGIFLLFFGSLLYFSALKAFFFMLFGFSGYCTHLAIDGKIGWIKIKNPQITNRKINASNPQTQQVHNSHHGNLG